MQIRIDVEERGEGATVPIAENEGVATEGEGSQVRGAGAGEGVAKSEDFLQAVGAGVAVLVG